MKSFFLGVTVTICLIAAAYFAFSLGKKSPSAASTNVPADSQIVGGDKDIHGCLGSAGYSWCESKQKCLRVWEEGCPDPTDATLITQALIQKNNWQSGSVLVTLSYNDGLYAGGGVPGGYVFAAKVNGDWVIVADGNGAILCSQLTPYPQFPASLIPACYDPATQKEITR